MNKFLISYLQTYSGKVMAACTFGLILFFSTQKNWIIAPLLILLCGFFRKERINILIFFNVAGWFFLGSLFDYNFYSFAARNMNFFNKIFQVKEIYYFNLMATFFCISFLFFVYWFFKLVEKKISASLYMFFVLILLIFSTNLFSNSSLLYKILFLLSAVVIKVFWLSVYNMNDSVGEVRNTKKFILSCSPIWLFGFQFTQIIPRGITDITSKEKADSVKIAESMLSGLKLAFLAMVCRLISLALAKIFFNTDIDNSIINLMDLPSLGFFDPNKGLAEYNLNQVSKLEMWLTVILKPALYFLYSSMGSMALIVAYIRLLGFRIHRNVYKPHQASSFALFLYRCFYYYSCIIKDFFYIPLYQFFVKFKLSSSAKVFWTTFFGILIGGMSLFFVRNPNLFILKGFSGYLEFTLTKLPYLVMLGFAVAYSVVKNRKKGLTDISFSKNFIRFSSYYFIYSIIYAAEAHNAKDTLSDVLTYFIKLFSF